MFRRARVTFGALSWAKMMLAGFALLNVGLVRENLKLSTLPDVQEDMELPESIGGVNIATERFITVDLQLRNTMLIYFSSYCPACRDSIEQLQALVRQIPPGWQVVWLSKDPLADTQTYFGEFRVDGLVLAELPRRNYVLLGMRGTPNVVLVGPDARVRSVWKGKLTEARREMVISDVMSATKGTQ